MKFSIAYLSGTPSASSPARGTWVEMILLAKKRRLWYCRLPHGGRGLKLFC